jgi:putative beta-barrel porin BBP2
LKSRNVPSALVESRPARPDRFACRRLALLGVLLLLGAPGAARAQGLVPTLGGIPAGRFVFYPSVSVDYTRDSNVLYLPSDGSSGEVVGSWVTLVRPRLVLDLPVGESRVSFAYSPLYRDYGTSKVDHPSRFSHYLDLDAIYRSPRGLSISLRDHFVRGTVEVREIDPGGETAFGLAPFELHEPLLDISMDLGARSGVSLLPRYSNNRFVSQAQASFFNYTRRGLEGRFNHRINPITTLYASYGLESTNQHRQDPVLNDINFGTRSFRIGLRRTIREGVTAECSIGYQTLRFDTTGLDNSTGWVADARWAWMLSDLTRLEFYGQRQPYQSFFENNSFYLVNQAGFRLTQQVGQRLYWILGSSYQQSLYPAVSPTFNLRRRDAGLSVEIGAGCQFQRTLRAFVGYNLDRRQSNIDGSDFDVNRFVFRIEAGWM